MEKYYNFVLKYIIYLNKKEVFKNLLFQKLRF